MYSLYLQGKYFMTPPRQDKEDMEKSVSAFQQALAIDPDYAPAWTGLSWAYEYQRRYRFLPWGQAIELSNVSGS